MKIAADSSRVQCVRSFVRPSALAGSGSSSNNRIISFDIEGCVISSGVGSVFVPDRLLRSLARSLVRSFSFSFFSFFFFSLLGCLVWFISPAQC